MKKTNKIIIDLIEKIEKAGKWEKTFISLNAYNPITKKHYKGVNTLLLENGNYATFNQIKKAGGSIKKGSKSSQIIFMSKIIKDNGKGNDENDEKQTYFCTKYFNVFNIDDCENMEKYKQKKDNKKDNEILDDTKLNNIINKYTTKELKNYNTNGSKACYIPATDTVKIPPAKTFKNGAGYYETVLHEIVHSTGHKNRLDRKLVGTLSKDLKSYAKEELIAEFGAMLILKKL